jgi:hypothetical protein
MKWIEEPAANEKLIVRGYRRIWNEFCDELVPCVITFGGHYPESAGSVIVDRNDHAGFIKIDGLTSILATLEHTDKPRTLYTGSDHHSRSDRIDTGLAVSREEVGWPDILLIPRPIDIMPTQRILCPRKQSGQNTT